jgi:hypothetical protein
MGIRPCHSPLACLKRRTVRTLGASGELPLGPRSSSGSRRAVAEDTSLENSQRRRTVWPNRIGAGFTVHGGSG